MQAWLQRASSYERRRCRGTGQEPDTSERFAEVPGRWMCATPTQKQANFHDLSLSLSLSLSLFLSSLFLSFFEPRAFVLPPQTLFPLLFSPFNAKVATRLILVLHFKFQSSPRLPKFIG